MNFIRYLLDIAPKFFTKIFFDGFNIFFFIPQKVLLNFTLLLKHHTLLQAVSLVEFTCVDTLSNNAINNRFEIFLNLISFNFNSRFFIYSSLKDTFIPSLTKVFCSSTWLEREIWDLFGIIFSSHPDLRRILTDYGFFGFPMRKDFPVTGFVEIRYSELRKRIITLELSLVQEFRNMDLVNPWIDT